MPDESLSAFNWMRAVTSAALFRVVITTFDVFGALIIETTRGPP